MICFLFSKFIYLGCALVIQPIDICPTYCPIIMTNVISYAGHITSPFGTKATGPVVWHTLGGVTKTLSIY